MGVDRLTIVLQPDDTGYRCWQSAALRIYTAYYAVGNRTYEKLGARSAVLRTFGAETVSATDCLTVIGWHQRAIELSGGTAVTVEETQCRARGAPYCEYRCEWS
jgi:hypothetical protein